MATPDIDIELGTTVEIDTEIEHKTQETSFTDVHQDPFEKHQTFSNNLDMIGSGKHVTTEYNGQLAEANTLEEVEGWFQLQVLSGKRNQQHVIDILEEDSIGEEVNTTLEDDELIVDKMYKPFEIDEADKLTPKGKKMEAVKQNFKQKALTAKIKVRAFKQGSQEVIKTIKENVRKGYRPLLEMEEEPIEFTNLRRRFHAMNVHTSGDEVERLNDDVVNALRQYNSEEDIADFTEIQQRYARLRPRGALAETAAMAGAGTNTFMKTPKGTFRSWYDKTSKEIHKRYLDASNTRIGKALKRLGRTTVGRKVGSAGKKIGKVTKVVGKAGKRVISSGTGQASVAGFATVGTISAIAYLYPGRDHKIKDVAGNVTYDIHEYEDAKDSIQHEKDKQAEKETEYQHKLEKFILEVQKNWLEYIKGKCKDRASQILLKDIVDNIKTGKAKPGPGHGANLPNTNYIGPGNTLDNGPVRSQADAVAWAHDWRYHLAIIKSDITEADYIAIQEFGELWDKHGDWQAFFGKLGLKAKVTIESLFGVTIYPQGLPDTVPDCSVSDLIHQYRYAQ